MPIYTGTGDEGETGLFDNQRVGKDDLRIESYGSIDEVNSLIGLLRAEPLPAEFDGHLARIQSVLFELAADLATPGARRAVPTAVRGRAELEQWIDASEAGLAPLRSFILPAGHRESALCHVIRTGTRRAERVFWALHRRDGAAPELGVYLNRLSDLFFSWARQCNHRHGVADVPWLGTDG